MSWSNEREGYWFQETYYASEDGHSSVFIPKEPAIEHSLDELSFLNTGGLGVQQLQLPNIMSSESLELEPYLLPDQCFHPTDNQLAAPALSPIRRRLSEDFSPEHPAGSPVTIGESVVKDRSSPSSGSPGRGSRGQSPVRFKTDRSDARSYQANPADLDAQARECALSNSWAVSFSSPSRRELRHTAAATINNATPEVIDLVSTPEVADSAAERRERPPEMQQLGETRSPSAQAAGFRDTRGFRDTPGFWNHCKDVGV
jgi:hypothetical protein